jgi:branched-chain amino acid transport system substrate-binding protein
MPRIEGSRNIPHGGADRLSRTKRRLSMRLSLIRAAAVAFSLMTVSGAARAEDAIRIGSSIPITGNLAFFGQHSRWGAELAVEEANAAGGALGRKIEIDFQDNRCNPSEAVKSVSQMLSDNKYVAIHDGLCSSVILAIMPLVERAGIPLVVANGSATAIAEKSGVGGNKWTFKVNPSDASLAAAMVGYLMDHMADKAKTIAFLGEDTDFGRSGSQGFEIALAQRGLKLASADYYQQGSADFTAVFTKIRSEHPALLALYAVGADFQNVIRQYVSFGVNIPLTGRVLSDQIPPEILQSGVLDGTTSVQPYVPEVDTPQNKVFVAAFQKKFNSLPNLLSRESYESMRVLIDAIRRAGKADPAAIRDALEKTKMPSILGGTLEFDDHHLAHDNAVIILIKDSKVGVIGLSKT